MTKTSSPDLLGKKSNSFVSASHSFCLHPRVNADTAFKVQARLCKLCNEPRASAVASQNTARTGKAGDLFDFTLDFTLFSTYPTFQSKSTFLG